VLFENTILSRETPHAIKELDELFVIKSNLIFIFAPNVLIP
jgi:hypothetical protein